MDALEYSRRRRDSKLENEMGATLRARPEEERFEFICELMDLNPHAATVLVRKIQLSPTSLESILNYGLMHGDASSVDWWLSATHNGLGPRRFLRTIAAHLDQNPQGVRNAVYFLPRYFPGIDEYQNAVTELRQEFDRRHPGFSRRSSIPSPNMH